MPGPGEWISVDGRWFPAQTKRIQRLVNQRTGLIQDVPITDEKTGEILYEKNPAALEALRKYHDSHDSAPVITFPEAKPQQVILANAPPSQEIADLKKQVEDLTKLVGAGASAGSVKLK